MVSDKSIKKLLYRLKSFDIIRSSVNEDIKRLKQSKRLILRTEDKKSVREIFKNLYSQACQKAKATIIKRLNSKIHKKIILKKMEKMSLKKLKPKY
jgi:precorrin-6B methylase 1